MSERAIVLKQPGDIRGMSSQLQIVNCKPQTVICYLLLLSGLVMAMIVAWDVSSIQAHGTNIRYQPTQAIEIIAQYDNGEAMAEAQVIVYAPNKPETPWLTGQANEDGYFVFVPDHSISGDWAVSIRTAGHGEMLHVPIEAGTVSTVQTNSGPTTLQTIVMGIAGVWGFVGTALFFSRRKS